MTHPDKEIRASLGGPYDPSSFLVNGALLPVSVPHPAARLKQRIMLITAAKNFFIFFFLSGFCKETGNL